MGRERVWGLTWPCKSEGNELEVSMGGGHACWIGYVSMEGLHGYEG